MSILTSFYKNCARRSVFSQLFPSIMSKPARDLSSQVKEIEQELKKNPYFDKYAHKISAIQQTNPEELVSRFEAGKPSSKPKENKSKELKVGKAKAPLKSEALSQTSNRQLSKIMKTELLVDKSADEVKKIWEEYFKGKDALAAAVPAHLYSIIEERSAKHPVFLFPLPRDQGYEFFLLQFDSGQIHFTPLISYQTHGADAPECLLMTYYTELKADKGIVLLHGEYDTNFLNAIEAQCLANQVQLYYGENDTHRTKLLEKFTMKPDSFDHMDLVKEVERLSF